MQVYKETTERLRRFYQSDYYNWLKLNDDRLCGIVENALYVDPDRDDEDLYEDLFKKYDNLVNLKPISHLKSEKCNLFLDFKEQEIKMSADFICGYKEIKAVSSNEEIFLSNYEKLRSSIKLHFLWPQHRLPTINTQRSVIYRDRIDYLLFDLKCYLNGEQKKTPMHKAYQNNNTKIWLDTFAGDFPKFVDEMHFKDFVDKNYEVLDIEKGQQKIVTGDLQDLVVKANKKVDKNSQERCYQKAYFKHLLTSEKFYRPDDLY